MKFTTTEVTLKNGETIVIREAQISDAEELINVVKEYVEESKFIPYAKGEFSPTISEEEKWIQSFSDNENSLLLLAVHNNHIIGNISVNGAQREMMKHTACIGIGMLLSYRGKGIGSVLFEKAINWVRENALLEILWLETYKTNESGIALYRKFGFSEIGKHPHFIKLPSGEYIDEITMTVKIK